MVKKLLKHEMIAYSRTMLIIEAIVLGFAIIARCIWAFETDSITYDIVNTSSIIAFVISIIVCLVFTVVIGITRFYKNLFGREGYLSFTLPVTIDQHVISKLLIALLYCVISVVAVIVALMIAGIGDPTLEVIKAIAYLAQRYFAVFKANGAFYILEAVIAVIVIIASEFLKYYACISVGQMAKKNRVLASFGAYFGYYIFCQILGTIFIIFMTTCYEYLPLEAIEEFVVKHPFGTIHIVIIAIAVFYALLSVAYYFVSRQIIKHRLNLE